MIMYSHVCTNICTDFKDDDLLLVLSKSDSTNRVIKQLVDSIKTCTERLVIYDCF